MIEIKEITKTFPDFQLNNISLSIAEKEYLAILGPTGSGKTLLLETIAGIFPPDSGRIMVNGDDITDAPPSRRQVGMVYQDYMLFPHLTLSQNIAFGLEARKIPAEQIRQKVSQMAEMLGIAHLLHRRPGTLSGGEQQRGAIARALVIEPTALLLDEPLSALDESTANRLQKEIKQIHQLTGATTIHITHRFEEAYVMADRIAVMKDGRIIQVDTPEGIFRRPRNHWVADFVGCRNLFQGAAQKEGDITMVTLQGLTMKSVTGLTGPVGLSVRPEDIYITRQPLNEPNLNSFSGRVTAIIDRGRLWEAEIDIGVPLLTVLTRQSAQKVSLQPGKAVHISFHARDTHLFPV